MSDDLELHHGPIGPNCIHLCVDMQRMFAEDTEWQTPWMARVLPNVAALCAAAPARTIFTRFMPAQRVGDCEGTWRRYYERWSSLTLERMGAEMADLLPGSRPLPSASRDHRQDRLFALVRTGAGRAPACAGCRYADRLGR